MLRWSDEPLEIFLDDPRSPARRLPAEEQEWLECTGAALLVPVVGAGPQRSWRSSRSARSDRRKPYTAEDRQLLASIAAQMGLGFDVARLRQRRRHAGGSSAGDDADSVAGVAADDGVPALRPVRGVGHGAVPRRRHAAAAGAVGAARRRQQVPHRAAARARRHGRGLPRARHAPRPAGRAQGRPRRAARRSRGAAALPARGADRRAAAAPVDRRRSSTTAPSPTAAPTW